MWYGSTVVPILRKERDCFFVLIQRGAAKAHPVNHYCSEPSEQGSLKAAFDTQEKHSTDCYTIIIDCRGMDFVWKLGMYFESGKAFYTVQQSLRLYSIGIHFSRCLRMLPVLAASSGGRQRAAVPQRCTTPKVHKKHVWEERQILLKSQERCCASGSKEGACAKQLKQLHFCALLLTWC